AIVRGDHHQVQVNSCGARDHRADEPLVSRHVDHRQRPARRERHRRIAELDRDPAGALLRQAIGVDSGEGMDQRRLAVVNVSRCSERQGLAGATGWRRPARIHAELSAALVAATTKATSSSVSVRGSSSTRPSWIRAITGGSALRNALAKSSGSASAPRATAGPASSSNGRAPPPTLALERTISAPEPIPLTIASARAVSSGSPASSIARTGISRLASSGSRYSASVADRAASESLSILTARASG